MEKYTQLFFIGNQQIGAGVAHLAVTHGEPHAPMSKVFICHECGEPWARVVVQSDSGKIRPWEVFMRNCWKHRSSVGSMFFCPGSLYLSWDKPYCRALPESVLQRELLTHLDFYEELNECHS
jgi:hypothetical protein